MITITLIDPNNPMSNGPAEINANLTAIKSHIDDLENLLNPATGSMKLTNLATIPANSVESATITLTATVGNVLVVSPGGIGSTLTITFDGVVTGKKYVANGSILADRSVFTFIEVQNDATFAGTTLFNGVVDLTGANSVVKNKTTVKTITDANCGGSATTKVDISKDQIVFLDYNNSGGALAGNGDVNFDLANLVEGQIVEIHCTRKNVSGNMKLYNGTSGNEIFAYVDPNAAGITTISYTTLPAFDVQPSPANKCYLRCQWYNIGAGVFRLLVIDSKGVLNVN